MAAYLFNPTTAGERVFRIAPFSFDSSRTALLFSLAAAFQRQETAREILGLPLYPSPGYYETHAPTTAEPLELTFGIKGDPDYPARDRFTPLTIGTITVSEP